MAFNGEATSNAPTLALNESSGAFGVGNSRSFVVPSGERWHIQNVVGRVTTSATAGNRLFVVELLDGSSNIQSRLPWANHAASLAVVYSMVRSGLSGVLQTAPALLVVAAGLPIIAQPGWTVRVRDIANIDAAADQSQFMLFGVREPV